MPINPFLIVVLVAVIASGTITYRRTKNVGKTALAVLVTLVIVYGLAFVADQFME